MTTKNGQIFLRSNMHILPWANKSQKKNLFFLRIRGHSITYEPMIKHNAAWLDETLRKQHSTMLWCKTQLFTSPTIATDFCGSFCDTFLFNKKFILLSKIAEKGSVSLFISKVCQLILSILCHVVAMLIHNLVQIYILKLRHGSKAFFTSIIDIKRNCKRKSV